MKQSIKQRLVDFILRPLYEAAGNPRFSRPALNNLDAKLSQYLDFRNGVFVELGANDGFQQSNTYYLEKFMSWTGVLVEPIPSLFEKARKRRSKSKVYNFACVADPQSTPYIEMVDLNLMSFVTGALKTDEEVNRHIESGEYYAQAAAKTVQVPTATLTQLLEQAAVTRIDFLSLDVEGYEAQVLRGLDLERFSPRYMLIEARYRDEVESIVSPYYELAEQMTNHDLFFVRRA
ncbi:FkbM family methyltransferase [Aggregatilineales bacterium SYSU G02658]